MTISAIITPQGMTVVLPGGKVTMMSKTDSSYEFALDAYRKNDLAKLESLMLPKQAIKKFSHGSLEFGEDGEVTFNGKRVENYAITKIKEMQGAGLPWKPLANFLERLLSNPSFRAVNELYKFLETENLPITEDGHFLAYKRVRDDWLDFHTGKILNKIGEFVTEPRNEVDDNPNHGCSKGLHAGALSYVRSFHSGGHLLIVKIDPADVVSVPNEDVRKLRTWRYFVVSEMEDVLDKSPLYTSSAQPVYKAEVVEDFVPEDCAECDGWDDCDCELDDEDEEAEDLISDIEEEIVAAACEVVGMKVATNVPLRRVMNDIEIEDFCNIVNDIFEVDFDDSDIQDMSLEAISQEVFERV